MTLTPQPGDLCISIRQPWAFMMIRGDIMGAARETLLKDSHTFKNVENRSWDTKIRGRCWIHASQRMSKVELKEARDWMEARGLWPKGVPPMLLEAELARGVIIGSVEITGPATKTSPWYMGEKGFTCSSPIVLDTFIPYKGRLGFFKLTAEGLGT